MECPSCGVENQPAAKFCKSCGSSLTDILDHDAAPEGPQARESDEPASAANEAELPPDSGDWGHPAGAAEPELQDVFHPETEDSRLSGEPQSGTAAGMSPVFERAGEFAQNRQKLLVLVGIAAAVVAILALAWSSYGRAAEADRASAAVAVSAAEVDVANTEVLARAEDEQAGLTRQAREALAEAQRTLKTGSVFNRAPYAKATRTANWARAQCESVEAMIAGIAAMDEAKPAVQPGSQEAKEMSKAQASLKKAVEVHKGGSMGDLQAYSAAAVESKFAQDTASGITQRIEDMLSKGQAMISSSKYGPGIAVFFGVYRKYPRTPQAKRALESAEEAILQKVKPASTPKDLRAIHGFLKTYPKRSKPREVMNQARRALVTLAASQCSRLAGVASTDRRWAAAMQSRGRTTDSLRGTDPSDARELAAIRALLPGLGQGAAMRKMYASLHSACKAGLKIRTAEASPTEQTSRAQYYTSGQVSEIASLSGVMSSNLATATRILKALKR